MTVSIKDKAQNALLSLMRSSLKDISKENVARAVFNAKYADAFRDKQEQWRKRWLGIWLIVGLTASFISLTSWLLAMTPRLGLLHIDPLIVSWLLILVASSTIITMISAAGLASVGKTPFLPKLL